jgi:hypothetical protein
MRPAAWVSILLIFAMLLPAQTVSAQGPGACEFQPRVAELLSRFDDAQWLQWILQFSGEQPVTIGSTTTRILSRHTQRMFIADPTARAFEYAQQLLKELLGQRAQFTVDPFLVYKPPEEIYNGQNLIVDLPGSTHPEEIVVLSAHLDSLSTRVQDPAPGADLQPGTI